MKRDDMKAQELKDLAAKILQDFQKTLNDLSAISGYVYDKRAVSRIERLYDSEIEKIIHQQLRYFQEEYIKRLNLLCDKAGKEMKNQLSDDAQKSTKFRFWSTIYQDKPVNLIAQKYHEAMSAKNLEFINFVEHHLISNRESEFSQSELKTMIQKNRKLRVTKKVKTEITQLNKLYGFYIQSLEFTKRRGLNLTSIQKLFNSLNTHFQTPLKKLLSKIPNESIS